MSRKSVSLFAAAAIAAALMAPAAAAQTAEPRSITVYYGDLNLSRADGINTLTGRLDRALDKVCGSTRDYANSMRIMITRCRTKALTDAIAEIDTPLLTEIYTPKKLMMLASR